MSHGSVIVVEYILDFFINNVTLSIILPFFVIKIIIIATWTYAKMPAKPS